MTPPAGSSDLTGVVAAINALTTAIGTSAADLAPLTAQVERVADALFVDPATDADGLAAVTAAGNAQVETVIAEDTAGQMRVQVNADMP